MGISIAEKNIESAFQRASGLALQAFHEAGIPANRLLTDEEKQKPHWWITLRGKLRQFAEFNPIGRGGPSASLDFDEEETRRSIAQVIASRVDSGGE